MTKPLLRMIVGEVVYTPSDPLADATTHDRIEYFAPEVFRDDVRFFMHDVCESWYRTATHYVYASIVEVDTGRQVYEGHRRGLTEEWEWSRAGFEPDYRFDVLCMHQFMRSTIPAEANA